MLESVKGSWWIISSETTYLWSMYCKSLVTHRLRRMKVDRFTYKIGLQKYSQRPCTYLCTSFCRNGRNDCAIAREPWDLFHKILFLHNVLVNVRSTVNIRLIIMREVVWNRPPVWWLRKETHFREVVSSNPESKCQFSHLICGKTCIVSFGENEQKRGWRWPLF